MLSFQSIILTESLTMQNQEKSAEKTETWSRSAKLFSSSSSKKEIEPLQYHLTPSAGWGEVNKLHLRAVGGGTEKQ